MGKTRSEKKNKKIWIYICAAFCLGMIAIFGGRAIAKYYAYKSERGISVASAFYFNSDKLVKDPGSTTLDAIKAIDVSDLTVNTNETKWNSGDTLFELEIRNYDNNLLFNDKDLNAGYAICFCLLGSGAGADYTITKGNEDATAMSLTEDKATCTFAGDLPGGNLSKDRYQVRITLNTGKGEFDADTKILVVAYPTAPDYVVNETNQQARLVGVFQGHLSEPDMKVESAKFLVQEDVDYNSGTWKKKVEDLSGLIFNIKTIGDVITDANNAVKQEAVIKWKGEYLQISEYDEYYAEAKEKNRVEVKTEGGIEWTYMTINILPYTSSDITFYKTSKFIEEFEKETDGMSQSDFEGLATAYVEGSTP